MTPSGTAVTGDANVIVVMLRRPKRHDPVEVRTDPLWEFGSFGCTRCHAQNLMNPRKLHQLTGSRLAFAQGGHGEVRLVHVTPPVRTVHHGLFGEAKWHPAEMPLEYKSAPVLVDNHGGTDVPGLIHMIDGVRRSSPVARFASKFRSTRTPLPTDLGRQLIAAYHTSRERGATVAQSYTDALPFPPPRIDQNRKRTYAELLASSFR